MTHPLTLSLKEPDRLLLAETELAAMRELSEDQLVDLHSRVRKQRNKYVSVYRRRATKKVKKSGGRGVAGPKSQRNRDQLEVFEDALSRVSRQLAVASRASANELRAERIAAARAAKAGSAKKAAPAKKAGKRAPRKSSTAPKPSTAKVGDRAHRSAASVQRRSTTHAANVRQQAKRDSS